MTLERAVGAFAGIMVLLSVALTYYVHPNWVWLTVFVGANLLQQAFTGVCSAAIIIRRAFGFKPCSEACSRTVATAASGRKQPVE